MHSVLVLDHVVVDRFNYDGQEDQHCLELASECMLVNSNRFSLDRLSLSDNENPKCMLYDDGHWQIKSAGTLTHKVKVPAESEGSPLI
jgi:hypothetical protein